jgi:hypothetical protein
MAALATERITPEALGGNCFGFPVDAGVITYFGGMVGVSHAGLARPAGSAPNLAIVGVAKQTRNNSQGAAGAETVEARRGVFAVANDGSVTSGMVGQPAYAVDDQTVSASSNSNTRSQAGLIMNVDANGVWVKF